jgi:hypothetical protein
MTLPGDEVRDDEVVERQAEANSAARRCPERPRGNVTRRNVSISLGVEVHRACSSRGSRLAIRALTATTTKLMQNITCAMTIVVKPEARAED